MTAVLHAIPTNPDLCDFHAACALPPTRRLNGRPACAAHAPTVVVIADIRHTTFERVADESPAAEEPLRNFDSESRVAAFHLYDPCSNKPDSLMKADDIELDLAPFRARRQRFIDAVWQAGNDAAEAMCAAGVR